MAVNLTPEQRAKGKDNFHQAVGKMAEDKIGAAERTAVAEVRARAADVAARAAATIIADTHGATADKPLVDKTIAGLGRFN